MPKSLKQKREEAAARQQATAALTPTQRLQRLDANGFTAGKERQRLLAKEATAAAHAALTAKPTTEVKVEEKKPQKGRRPRMYLGME